MGLRGVHSVVVAGLVLAPVAARAADMPPVEPVDVAVANAAHDWTGVYVGVNAGYSFGDFDFTPGPSTGGSFDGKGALGGFQIGYNKQIGSVVIGVEGDIQAAGIDGDASGQSANIDWFSTVRGRVGYAFDRTLLYGTAGGLAAGIGTDIDGAGGGSDTQTAWGFAAGAGVEHSVTDNISLKAEYLFLDTKEETFQAGTTQQQGEWDGHVMRFGANLKF